MPEYIFQAVQLGLEGAEHFVCHESDFHAADLESAIVTANALLEVIPVSDQCNMIQVLGLDRGLLWRRPIEPFEHTNH